MPATQLLGGLFDRPLVPKDGTALTARVRTDGGPDYPLCDEIDAFCIDGQCLPGYAVDIIGQCEYIEGGPQPFLPPTPTTMPTETTAASPNVTVIVNNAVTATDEGVEQVASAVNSAIRAASDAASQIATDTATKVASGIKGVVDSIASGIASAFGNIGDVLKLIASTIWDNLKSIVGTIADNIGDLLSKIRDFLTPILTSIKDVVDTITKQVQLINDTLIKPIADLYNSTIKTVATLTTAIEQDLHEGIGGLLKIPGQLADQLGSFDATLNRTVQQLGTANKETITAGVKEFGDTVPTPFGAAMAKALGGNSITSVLSTTFGGKVNLSSESLQQVSQEAISGLGTLLREILSITVESFKDSFDNLHADWASVGSVFVGLLDGLLGIITTLTAIGAITEPLIEAAKEEANTLIPIVKLDPATVIEAMRRGILTSQAGITEISKHGIDKTRTQVLIDLDVFLADINQALDWWYRGIIGEDDLTANLTAHGMESSDQIAFKAGSVNLPSLADLQRWLDFGIITNGEFTTNAKVLRYDDAQITAILSTYQARETPQTRAQLDGLLNNSSAGWLTGTLNLPVPPDVSLAGARAGYHPDLVRYIWLSHWSLPSVQQFVQSYFRGLRTKTELEQRLAIENIPKEVWDELVQIQRPLIPFRSIPSYVKNGLMSESQAEDELAAHGFDLAHVQIILKAIKPVAAATTATAVAAVHTLSQSNAKTLWSEGAITDAQYTEVLEAHGYTADTAALQLKADAITEHIKAQKSTLADYTAQVEAGVLSLDDAVSQLTLAGFTTAQVAKFQVAVTKSLKVNAKHPSLGELKTFLKAQVIDIDVFKAELQAQGWTDPWLSAFVQLETAPPDTGNAQS